MVNDLQRVFIHETGHLIAAELNYSLSNYDRRIEKFTISSRNNSPYYNGEVCSSKAALGEYNPQTCANEYIQTFYGCLFESIYREIQLELCLKNSVSREEHLIDNIGNGKVDALYLFSIGLRKEIKNISSLWYKCIFDYFKKMRNLENHFELVFKVDVNNFIYENSDTKNYSIDINSLVIELHDFLRLHKPYYKILLETLLQIQNQNQQ